MDKMDMEKKQFPHLRFNPKTAQVANSTQNHYGCKAVSNLNLKKRVGYRLTLSSYKIHFLYIQQTKIKR